MTSMFEVPAAGAYTYYYLAYEYSGSVSVADMQINLVYFPTAYGDVDPVPPPPVQPYNDGDSNLLDGFIKTTVNTKPTRSDSLSISGLERELAALKREIEILKQKIDSTRIREP